MRLSVLSSTAMVSCGFSVFGRPLAAPQEMSDSVQDVPLASNPALPGLPTLPTVSNMLAYTSLSNPDTSTTVPPEIRPEVSTGFGGYPDSKSADLFTSSSGALALSSSDTANTFTLFGTQSPPTYDFEADVPLRQSLEGIPSMDFKYCIFWMTDQKSSLWTSPTCRVIHTKPDSWEDFKAAFADSPPGFAVYYQGSAQVYSFMNLVTPCRDDQLARYVNCYDKEDLAVFKPHWVKLLRDIFGDGNVRSVDNVNGALPARIKDVVWQ